MSDQQLQRLESRVEVLGGRADQIGQELKDLRQDMQEMGHVLRHDMQAMRQDLRQEMQEMGHGLRREMQDMGQDLRNRIDEGQRHMHVLHQDLVGRIKALPPDFGPIRREFRREIIELRESIDRRLIPLEAAERMRRKPKR